MEIICTKAEMEELQKAVKTNLKLANLVATMREFDLISEDPNNGIIVLHRDCIPAIIDRSID